MAITRTPEPWAVSALGDSPTGWAISMTEEDAGWEIEARWWSTPHMGVTRGPREVIIRRSPGAPEDSRGITTTVMRNLERLLSEMIENSMRRARNENDQSTADAAESDRAWREVLVSLVKALPPGPRSDPHAYYAGLLDLFELIDAVSAEPLKELHEAMKAAGLDVPKETVKTRLRVARQRRTADSG